MATASVTDSPLESFPFLDDWAAGFHELVRRRALDLGVSERRIDEALADPVGRTSLLTHLSGIEGVTPAASLGGLLGHEHRAISVGHGVQLWRSMPAVYLDIVRRSGPGSRRADSLRARLLDEHGDLFASSVPLVAEGLDLLHRHAPGHLRDLATFTHAVVLLDEGAAFRGASGLPHHGVSFFSPDASWDAVVWAEELLHEGTHNLLDAVDAVRPLMQGDDVMEELHDAPLRPDKRPLYGNFHATLVLARLVSFGRSLPARASSQAARDSATERHSGYLAAGRLALASLMDHHGSITPFGLSLLRGIAVPVLAD